MSSQTNHWNPEKPPEQENDVLLIPGTTYSRRWLIQLLAQLVKLVGLPVPDEVQTDTDFNLEQELCDLWDASVNEGVADMLARLNAHQLFVHLSLNPDCLAPINSDRARELSLGILANMCCFEGHRERARPFLTELLSIHEMTQSVEALVQLYRIVSCLMQAGRHGCEPDGPIIHFLRERVVYTLANCLNEDLLTIASTLFRQMVDAFVVTEPNVMITNDLVRAVENALETLRWKTDASADLLNGLLTLCPYLPETSQVQSSLSSIVVLGLKTDEQDRANLVATFIEAICSERPELLDYARLIDEIDARMATPLVKVATERPSLLCAADVRRRRRFCGFVSGLLKKALGVEGEDDDEGNGAPSSAC